MNDNILKKFWDSLTSSEIGSEVSNLPKNANTAMIELTEMAPVLKVGAVAIGFLTLGIFISNLQQTAELKKLTKNKK